MAKPNARASLAGLGFALALILALPVSVLASPLASSGERSTASPSPRAADEIRCPSPFKLEINFRTEPGWLNAYPISLFGTLVEPREVADSSLANPCVGPGDGVLNADDLLCGFWTSRRGGMTVSRLDPTTQAWESRTALFDESLGIIVFAGPWTAPLALPEGVLVSVSPPSTGPVDNDTLITIWAGAGGICVPVQPSPLGGSTTILLPLAWHVAYWTADEVLCGSEGVDWVDADFDGDPDTCPGGAFAGGPGTTMSVTHHDSFPGSGGGTTPAFDNVFVSRAVQRDAFSGQLHFSGVDYVLAPAQAYWLSFGPSHPATNFCPPTW
jgi:hypothetical protein